MSASHDGAPAMSQAPTIADEARSLEEEFALFDDWRDKVEYIIDLGKNLPVLPEPLKTEANKVRGCQSQVWMVAEPESGGRVHWRRWFARLGLPAAPETAHRPPAPPPRIFPVPSCAHFPCLQRSKAAPADLGPGAGQHQRHPVIRQGDAE